MTLRYNSNMWRVALNGKPSRASLNRFDSRPHRTASRVPKRLRVNRAEGALLMTNTSLLPIDLAKGSFQVRADGAEQSSAVSGRACGAPGRAAVMHGGHETCATSHHWDRMAQLNGDEVRLLPAACVKPFVKCQKNDHADAEAIA